MCPSRPSPCFSYCKQQKLGMEAWEQGYTGMEAWEQGYTGICLQGNHDPVTTLSPLRDFLTLNGQVLDKRVSTLNYYGTYYSAFSSFSFSSILMASLYCVSNRMIWIVITAKLRASTHRPTLAGPDGQSAPWEPGTTTQELLHIIFTVLSLDDCAQESMMMSSLLNDDVVMCSCYVWHRTQ